MDKQERSSSPIFILSTARSGSTLLRYIMDSHPDICSPVELNLGILCSKLYESVNSTIGQLYSANPMLRESIVIQEVRKLIDGFMTPYSRSKQKRIWCEKSPDNVLYVKMLKRVFPDARYICLYRNCLDVVHSMMGLSKYGVMQEVWDHLLRTRFTSVDARATNIVNAMIDYWIERTYLELDFERNQYHKCFRVKYKDLVWYPEMVLQDMFNFLNVVWDPTIIKTVFSLHHDRGPGDPKILHTKIINKDSIGRGSNIPRETISDETLTRMNKCLKELGYPEVGPNWNEIDSPYIPGAEVERSVVEASKFDELQLAAMEVTATFIDPPPTSEMHLPDQQRIRVLMPSNRVVKTVREVFEDYVRRQLDHSIGQFNEMKAVKVVVTGNDSGIWTIDFSKRSVIEHGSGNADCTITISSNDLIAIVNRDLNAAEALLQGQIRISGSVELAESFGAFMFGS